MLLDYHSGRSIFVTVVDLKKIVEWFFNKQSKSCSVYETISTLCSVRYLLFYISRLYGLHFAIPY